MYVIELDDQGLLDEAQYAGVYTIGPFDNINDAKSWLAEHDELLDKANLVTNGPIRLLHPDVEAAARIESDLEL